MVSAIWSNVMPLSLFSTNELWLPLIIYSPLKPFKPDHLETALGKHAESSPYLYSASPLLLVGGVIAPACTASSHKMPRQQYRSSPLIMRRSRLVPCLYCPERRAAIHCALMPGFMLVDIACLCSLRWRRLVVNRVMLQVSSEMFLDDVC